MTALDKFYSLDETVRAIREEHADTLKKANDSLMACQIELELHKKRLAELQIDRDKYQRLAIKLITQFGTVEAVFAEAKQLALQHSTTLPETRPDVDLDALAKATLEKIGETK